MGLFKEIEVPALIALLTVITNNTLPLVAAVMVAIKPPLSLIIINPAFILIVLVTLIIVLSRQLLLAIMVFRIFKRDPMIAIL